ncbi:MAG: hypothetical protein K9M99_01930, partial [Candidatus Cloacimonetes bacterium]|nr:hypothetical protein [Candidatus Cloacimonadota bacterium]
KTFDTTEFSGSISEGIKEAISFINYDEVYQKLQASRSSTVKYKAEHSSKNWITDKTISENNIQYNKETIIFDPKITAFKILVLNPLKGAMQDVSIAVQLFVHWVPQAKIEYITSASGVMNYIKLTDNSTDYHYKLVHEGDFTYVTSLRYLFGTNYQNLQDPQVNNLLNDNYTVPTLLELERFVSAFNVSLITYEDNSLRDDPFSMLSVKNVSEMYLAIKGEDDDKVIDGMAYHLRYNKDKNRIETELVNHSSGATIELLMIKEIK